MHGISAFPADHARTRVSRSSSQLSGPGGRQSAFRPLTKGARMSSAPHPYSVRRAVLPLLLTASAAAQTPGTVFPHFVPWFYNESDGRSVWDRHRFYEDNANTVFALARE